MVAKVMKATWEIASAAILVYVVAAVGVADQIAPRETSHLMMRLESQTERLIQFLLRE